MRIAAVSYLHGHLPVIPTCDLLIVAGDVSPDRFGPFLAQHAPEQQKAWFDERVRSWLADSPAVHKVLTWGNHDWCGQMCNFRRDAPEEALTTHLQILVDDVTSVGSSEGPTGGDGLGQPVVESVHELGVHERARGTRVGLRGNPGGH